MGQLAGVDAAIWYMESKHQPLHISALVKVVPYPKGDLNVLAIVDHLRVAASSTPMLKLMVVDSPIPLSLPYWNEVEELDSNRHIFLHRLVDQGDGQSPLERSSYLRSSVAKILAEPLQRDVPPWEIHVFDLIDEVQILTKIHHALLDGAGGLALLASLMDQEEVDSLVTRGSSDSERYGAKGSSGSRPNLFRALMDLPQEALNRLESAATFQDTLSQLVAAVAKGDEGSLPEALNFGAPKLPFSGALRSSRDVVSFTVETSHLRKIARYLRATLNDVVLAASSVTFERYLKEVYEFELSASPIVLMPISAKRGSNSSAHNQVGGQLIALPYGKGGIRDALSAVKEEAWKAKRLHSRYGPKMLESFAASIASPLLSPFMRFVGDAKVFDRLDPVFNFIISNVPGTTDELYLEGNLVDSIVPFGPLAEGAPLNITFVSYLDFTHFGITSCPDIVKAPDRIAEIFCEVVDKFLDEVLKSSD